MSALNKHSQWLVTVCFLHSVVFNWSQKPLLATSSTHAKFQARLIFFSFNKFSTISKFKVLNIFQSFSIFFKLFQAFSSFFRRYHFETPSFFFCCFTIDFITVASFFYIFYQSISASYWPRTTRVRSSSSYVRTTEYRVVTTPGRGLLKNASILIL